MQTRERAHCARSVFSFIKKKKKKCSMAGWYPTYQFICSMVGWCADIPVHMFYCRVVSRCTSSHVLRPGGTPTHQFVCSMAGCYAYIPVSMLFYGWVVSRRTNEHLLGTQQRSSYFAVASHESLLLFVFFHFEVCMIENECSEKREACLFFFFFF